MRKRFFALLPAAVLGLAAGTLLSSTAWAAVAPAPTLAPVPVPAPAPIPAPAPVPVAPVPQYVPPTVAVTNPLAAVKYNNKWEIYGGMGYEHFDAGPQLVKGASLGGVDVQVARYFTPRWAAVGNYRGYFGSTGAQPNAYGIRGPFVAEHFFVGGPEYRLLYNRHLSLNLHAYVGGVYGDFQRSTSPLTTKQVQSFLGLYTDQWSIASVIGGSIDLNRSARWAFRIEPDAVLTHYNNPGGPSGVQQQFAISVGVVYRFIPHTQKEHEKSAGHHRFLGVL